jgi:hypothetical protein
MAEQIGKIEKPLAEDFKNGRKLYLVPLIYEGDKLPNEYLFLVNKYWRQVEKQVEDLESKLGQINRIYHELISSTGGEGLIKLKDMSKYSYRFIERRIKKGSQFEAIEDAEILSELMDWNRCIAIGLKNPRVVSEIYRYFSESNKRRNEFITRRIDETLKADEIGILFLSEGHQIQLPPGVEIFYVSPPELDGIKRWSREWETKLAKKESDEQRAKGDSPQTT